MNKEKDDFQKKYDDEDYNEDPQADYAQMPAKDDILDLLLDGENKDAVDELINSFIEKVEQKLADEDQTISRMRNAEHTKLVKDTQDGQ